MPTLVSASHVGSGPHEGLGPWQHRSNSDITSLCALQLTKESTVVLAKGSAPNVKLDDKFYKLVDKMEVHPSGPAQPVLGLRTKLCRCSSLSGHAARLDHIPCVHCSHAHSTCATSDAHRSGDAPACADLSLCWQALTLGIPSLIEATSLVVKGPVKFVPGVKIIGDVTFTNGVLPS